MIEYVMVLIFTTGAMGAQGITMTEMATFADKAACTTVAKSHTEENQGHGFYHCFTRTQLKNIASYGVKMYGQKKNGL